MAAGGGSGGRGGADGGCVRGDGTCGTCGTVRRCGGAGVPPPEPAGTTCTGGGTGSNDWSVPAAYRPSFMSFSSDNRMGDISES